MIPSPSCPLFCPKQISGRTARLIHLGVLEMDYDEIEAPQYYALLFYRWDYTDLCKRLTKKEKIGVVRRNYILLKHSQAAEYIGRLTDKHVSFSMT